MTTPWMFRTATLFTLLGTACASAPPPKPAPVVSQPAASSSTGAAIATTAVATQLVLPDPKKPISPALAPIKVDAKLVSYDRVALIWGNTTCLVRPWVVTVVDLGTRLVTARALASTSELSLYFPSPTGELCAKGPCPTMAVEMAIPPELVGPSTYSGTGTMMGGTGKGLYALPSGTACPEPAMLTDGDLYDLAWRLVQGRNDAAAAVAGRITPTR